MTADGVDDGAGADDPGAQITAFRDLLALGVPEPAIVALLTDEEVVALAEGEPDDLTSLPWLSTLDGVEPDVAAAFGRRSLLTRGVIRPMPGGPADVDPHLRTALALLRGGRGFVNLTSPEGDSAALFVSVQPETGVVEEDVTRSGLHTVTVCTYADARDRAVRWAWTTAEGERPRADAAAGVSPQTRRLPVDQWPELVESVLGRARVVDVQGQGYGGDGDAATAVQAQLAVSSAGALLLTSAEAAGAGSPTDLGVARVVEPRDLDELLAPVLAPHRP